MKKILVLGAGRSSSSLINYLKKHAAEQDWTITIGDAHLPLAQKKAGSDPRVGAVYFDVNDVTWRKELIQQHDLIISLMPPSFHFLVAQTCVEFSKNLLTASYVSPEIASLDKLAKEKNILIAMECGLDPGIDHMSSMKEIKAIKEKGGKLTLFKSFTGGLVSPKSDNNPWHYKITWNPRNVVTAGKGTSIYLEEGKVKEVAYKDLFSTIETISVKGYGDFEGYPNRDSLKYLDTYELKDLTAFLRDTLRRPGYCSSWYILVKLGYTDEQLKMREPSITYRQLTEFLLKDTKGVTAEAKLLSLGTKESVEKVVWLGILEERIIDLEEFSPADALQKLMEERWKLQSGDKDMIVMQHQFEYLKEGKNHKMYSSLVVEGDDEIETAMAKTVGLPLAITAKLILAGKVNLTGVQIPVKEELYAPILRELEELGIRFINEDMRL